MMNKPKPIRIDYVLITVNKQERDGVREVFDLPYDPEENDLMYRWGYLENGDCIAHVDLKDNSGIGYASTITHKICEVLCPSIILVLGTAAGIHGEKEEGAEDRPELGDIVVSKIIRYGTFSDNHLKEQPVIQPDSKLHKKIDEIIDGKKWLCDVKSKIPIKIRHLFKPKKLISEEILTANQIVKELHNDPKLLQIFQKYPRLVAVDMEAGAIGSSLFDNFSFGKWAPKLFVVKGVSDIVDNRTPYYDNQSAEITQKEIRQLSRKHVAAASAAFAKNLIENYEPAKSSPNRAIRYLPEKFHGIGYINNDCSGVLYGIQPEEYSKIAAHIYNRLSETNKNKFFTVCAYDPAILRGTALRRYISRHNGNAPLNDKQLTDWTLDNFTHFKMFGDKAKNNEERDTHCVRIIILEGSTKKDNINENIYWVNHIEKVDWHFFCVVNQDVPCWGIGRYDLIEKKYDEKGFLTDYVIIGDCNLLDYYDESKTLVLTDVCHEDTIEHYLGLKNMFFENISTSESIFVQFVELNTEAGNAFTKELK